MPRWVKHILGILFVMAVAACSGSSACAGCGGLNPLPSGFDESARIENAASARLTKFGLSFIQNNIGSLAGQMLGGSADSAPGLVTFPIEETRESGGLNLYDFTICPDGPDAANGRCVAEINLADAKIDLSAVNPHDIRATGTIPLRLKSLRIKGSVLYAVSVDLDAVVSGGGKGDCDPDSMSYADIPMEAQVSVEVERNPAHSSRLGYSKLTVVSVAIDNDALANSLHFCGSGIGDKVAQWLKGFLGPRLMDGFTASLDDTINDMLCLKPDATKLAPCPNGSIENDGKCMYPDGSCASMMLGVDGNVDLSGFLATVSPGATGGLDFLLAAGGKGARQDNGSAAWGDLNPVGGGVTLGMIGGVLPNPVSDCVKPVTLELPTGIPQPDELTGNTLPGWDGDGPDVGIAVSERFLNHSLGAIYNSGVLCLGVSTEQQDLLTTGLFGLLVPSIKLLAYQKQASPLAVALRPQKPPTLTLGGGTDIETDPFVTVALPEAMVDFYVWSSDRYVRAFTAQFDLSLPINLDVSSEGLTPVLEKIHVDNAQVTNSDLLSENPDAIAAALSSVLEGLAGSVLGGLEPFDVSAAIENFGLSLDLRREGIKRLRKGNDSFLGIFAGFALATSPLSLHSETTAEVVDKSTPAAGFRLATATPQNRPRVIVRASSSLDYGPNLVEYTYKLDKGLWHPWQLDREIIVDDAFLLMQGVHTVAIKSRIVGHPETEDVSPTLLDVRIDVDPPSVDIKTTKTGAIGVDAWDIVSPRSELTARYRFDSGTETSWVLMDDLEALSTDPTASSMTVDVRDEEGNIASTHQSLIRGRADPALPGAASGCDCSVPRSTRGSGGTSSAVVVLSLGLLGLALRLGSRRRHGNQSDKGRAFFRGVVGSATVMALVGSWAGCNCNDDTEGEDQQPGPRDGTGDACGTEGADPCVVLSPGMIGSYTSAAVAQDGTLWVAGYNEADWDGNFTYGDLVVGKWNGKSVDWDSVDGVPDEAADEQVYDTDSWRGGVVSAGPDVGQWTSVQVDDSGNPRVAYWDITNGALKFASFDGAAWSVSTVFSDDRAEAGRYAKMLLSGGLPIIAFQSIFFGDSGYPKSKVVLARAKTVDPSGPGDWSFEDVAVDEATPCRDQFCTGSQKCFQESKQCADLTSDCDPKCAGGTGCINGVCLELRASTKIDTYPEAIGNYIALAAGPGGELGIVYYDRIRGNLVQARQDQGSWAIAVLDGQTADEPPVDTGDVGMGASLAIDGSGDWHISYVDGLAESLKYMQLTQNGLRLVGIEIVDNGAGTEAGPFDDGIHVVGDDSNITVSAAGDVRIAYQDATAGTLRWAVGSPTSGAGHGWKRSMIQQDGFSGFFPHQVSLNSSTYVVNWWRKGGGKTEGDVRVVSPI